MEKEIQVIEKKAVLDLLEEFWQELNGCGNTQVEKAKIRLCSNIIQLKTINLKEGVLDIKENKKEELAQKYIEYTFKRHNIDANSKEGQLIYYAYMHGMNQCLTFLRK